MSMSCNVLDEFCVINFHEQNIYDFSYIAQYTSSIRVSILHLLFTQFLFCSNIVNQAIFLSRRRKRLLVQEPKLGSVKSFDDDMACCVEISLNIQTFSSSSPHKTWRQIEKGGNLGQCETQVVYFQGKGAGALLFWCWRLIYRSSFSNWCDEM